jgi:cyclic pyranopterin phosphate synthase
VNDEHRIDSHKLEFHPERVAQWREAGDDWELAKSVYPIYVEVSPVGACNHRCTFCAVDYIGYKAVMLEAELLSERLAEMHALGVKSVMFAGEGEPLLHKQISRIVNDAYFDGLDVAFTTNGVLLDRLENLDHCEWIKISLNAGTEETYDRVHRGKAGDWGRVWEAIERAVLRKGDCTIGVQMVMLPENVGETRALEKRCQDVGVDYLVLKPYSQHKFSLTRGYEGYKPIAMPATGKKVVVREQAIKTEKHEYDKCNATPYFWAYIMASGDVYGCSAYLLDPRFNYGNLKEQTFKSVWEGERRRDNWEYVRKHLDIKDCRVNCRMDKANRYLAGFDTLSHINFV